VAGVAQYDLAEPRERHPMAARCGRITHRTCRAAFSTASSMSRGPRPINARPSLGQSVLTSSIIASITALRFRRPQGRRSHNPETDVDQPPAAGLGSAGTSPPCASRTACIREAPFRTRGLLRLPSAGRVARPPISRCSAGSRTHSSILHGDVGTKQPLHSNRAQGYLDAGAFE